MLLLFLLAWWMPNGWTLAPSWLAYLFIGISLLTLPHMLLVDGLYRSMGYSEL
ncbi:MAG: hypothetical protein HC821_04770 [Lewinella sp.]|nr:hypothetical protein [Lewinella sp.]